MDSSGQPETTTDLSVLGVSLLAPLQLAIQAAGSAGMELKNIVEFYRQWKEIG